MRADRRPCRPGSTCCSSSSASTRQGCSGHTCSDAWQALALLQAMLFSPFVLTGVCFAAGMLYVAHGMGQLDALIGAAPVLLVRLRDATLAKINPPAAAAPKQ